MAQAPVILWLRRDFRFHDHRAMMAAHETGAPVIALFICDAQIEGLGAAPKWRLGLAIEAFAKALSERGGRLILRRGNALRVLQEMISVTGAVAVHWSRAYDEEAIARDTEVKSALKAQGIEAVSHAGHLLFEPWSVATQKGEAYKVYTPYWRAVKDRGVNAPVRVVEKWSAPADWPESDALRDWGLGDGMQRGAQVVAGHVQVGEAAALDRLRRFTEEKIDSYKANRDIPSHHATSGLSENLTYGEISPRVIWHAGWRRMEEGASGAEHFLKELVWREFAWHLMYHFPQLPDQTWRKEWRDFVWHDDNDDAELWRRGMTGEPFVDAAMREMYVTGTMHNRARMIVASYLTKHLRVDWRVGRRWFEECLIDWDPASNAMGWQWVAGCGPDASPYFRVFNPATQAEKFDGDQTYRRAFIAEGQDPPAETAQAFFKAVPKSWGLDASQRYPKPIVDLKAGREAALEAYQDFKS
ncbi:deoxyribodipyrimidine photolyase [Thioclava sp. SK-1]|uniref:cryptochrome/photolyase family protein n=1 Tax=Thioclava sp. SK-1 TaxID=1889770 RepID=UPI000826FFB6|nr:deoxyribodipyrimidine photo-lyase [Thioclava sp. SK-1]OCX63184.1 deoxyribodipyrimidine photolyase [Thioclava sp. SK-1]